ncbi:hypothetical protein LEMLEM_LOCUS26387 [Lemmus lemmus]
MPAHIWTIGAGIKCVDHHCLTATSALRKICLRPHTTIKSHEELSPLCPSPVLHLCPLILSWSYPSSHETQKSLSSIAQGLNALSDFISHLPLCRSPRLSESQVNSTPTVSTSFLIVPITPLL